MPGSCTARLRPPTPTLLTSWALLHHHLTCDKKRLVHRQQNCFCACCRCLRVRPLLLVKGGNVRAAPSTPSVNKPPARPTTVQSNASTTCCGVCMPLGLQSHGKKRPRLCESAPQTKAGVMYILGVVVERVVALARSRRKAHHPHL